MTSQQLKIGPTFQIPKALNYDQVEGITHSILMYKGMKIIYGTATNPVVQMQKKKRKRKIRFVEIKKCLPREERNMAWGLMQLN